MGGFAHGFDALARGRRLTDIQHLARTAQARRIDLAGIAASLPGNQCPDGADNQENQDKRKQRSAQVDQEIAPLGR